MNNIILQICQQFITEVMEFFKEGKAVSLAEMESKRKIKPTLKAGRALCKSYF